MERKRIENRKKFWKNQKAKMLRKSDGHCAHCGCGLTVDTMTVEHVIPLHKGGTNDLVNTVALCEVCNNRKGSYVVNPEEWYSYLNNDSKRELTAYYEKYLKDFDYISLKSFFKTEVFNISPYDLEKGLSRSNRRAFAVEAKKYQKSVILLGSKDRENVYKFCDVFNKKVQGADNVKFDRVAVKEILQNYAVYGFKSGDSYSGLMVVRPIRTGYYGMALSIELLPAYKACEHHMVMLLYNVYKSLGERSAGICKFVITYPKGMSCFNDLKMWFGVQKVVSVSEAFYECEVVYLADSSILGGRKITVKDDFIYSKFRYLFDKEMPELKRYEYYFKAPKWKRKLMIAWEFIKDWAKCLNPLSFRLRENYKFYKVIKSSMEDQFITDAVKVFLFPLLLGTGFLFILDAGISALLGINILFRYGIFVLFSLSLYGAFRFIKHDRRCRSILKDEKVN